MINTNCAPVPAGEPLHYLPSTPQQFHSLDIYQLHIHTLIMPKEQQHDNSATPETLQDGGALPKLIAFDLDYTLW